MDVVGAEWAMELAEFYLDESESGDGRWLCVAGWMFAKEAREALHAEWSRLLTKWRLPYFRMTDCAHGNGPFADHDRDARIEIQKRFFEPLKRLAVVGFASSYDLKLAYLCPTASDDLGKFHVTPYTLCCYWALLHAKQWADAAGFDGRIAYFFEAGHASQSQANRMMGQVFSNPRLREIFRYAAHSFVEKRQSAAVQCADILAWQWGKNVKDRAARIMKPRADLVALLEAIPCQTVHFNELVIRGFLEVIQKHADEGAISAQSLNAYWASIALAMPSYWSGQPPYGALPH